MRKNSRLHFSIETDIFNALKKEAEQEGLSISALCRHKLCEYPKLTKIEFMIENIEKKLNTKLNLNRR